MSEPDSLEARFEKFLFASRWLMAPMYLGLVVALGMLLVVFTKEIFYYLPQIMDMKGEDVILVVLTLIDLTLASPAIAAVSSDPDGPGLSDLVLGGASFMAFMVMAQFGFSPEALFAKSVEIKTALAANAGKTPEEAAKIGFSIMGPGGFVKDPISAISFGMALMFGTAGLPHILMRFFTVPNAKEARKSVLWATTWIGYFYILTFIIGFGAITNLIPNPSEYYVGGELAKGLKGGGNMAAVHLAQAVGGNLFLGFISAVAFATILAVVAGLTLSGASAVSHDLYASVFAKGCSSESELRVSKITTVCLGILAVVLGIAFEKENVAYMVMLAFVIACSSNFPVLFMSVLWKNCTTRGAVVGGFTGLALAVILTIGSASVWEAVMGNPKGSAWFPYNSAAIFSMTAAFVTIWLVSILDNSAQAKKERALYPAQQLRSETGLGASGASGH